MGKKRTRTSQTSKGERRSIVNGVKEVRQSRTELDKYLTKLEAWRRGKNPWLSIPNPSRGTNQPFIRVRSNAYWGDPNKSYSIYKSKESE